MTRKEAVEYVLSKKGAVETYPFDESTLVFKVGGKMFGLVYDHKGELGLNLKCDPDFSLVLRGQFEGIFPGYHMNKKNTGTRCYLIQMYLMMRLSILLIFHMRLFFLSL